MFYTYTLVPHKGQVIDGCLIEPIRDLLTPAKLPSDWIYLGHQQLSDLQRHHIGSFFAGNPSNIPKYVITMDGDREWTSREAITYKIEECGRVDKIDTLLKRGEWDIHNGLRILRDCRRILWKRASRRCLFAEHQWRLPSKASGFTHTPVSKQSIMTPEWKLQTESSQITTLSRLA